MKKNKIILIITIICIMISVSAVSATDTNNEGLNIKNEDANTLLVENQLNDKTNLLDSNINQGLINQSSHREDSLDENINDFIPNNKNINNFILSNNNINENNALESNMYNLYVDINNGDDSNDGKTPENPLKTFEKALNLSENNYTIYLSNGEYSGLTNTGLTINKSLNIIGNENTTFNGLNKNHIFIIEDNLKINFKNINFINGYKDSRITQSNKVYGGALEIKKSQASIENCKFISNILDYYNEEYKYGAAISNFGDLTIVNSYFYNNSISTNNQIICYGACIYNKGNIIISNSSFIESKGNKYTYGAGIYNDGTINMENSIIANSYAKEESRGSAIYNKGNFTLKNSIIENNTIERLNFNYIQGNIFNSGNFIAIGNIFANNSGYYKQPNKEYEGSPNIYNVGDLNLTYNAFINNAPFNKISQDLYISGGKNINIANNFWETNNNPFSENKINLNIIDSWIIMDLNPKYSSLNIGQSLELIASLKSNNDEIIQINLLPKLNISFLIDNELISEEELINGTNAFNHIFTEKGRYNITGRINNLTNSVIVDVGKKESFIDFNMSENINYDENLEINLTVYDEDSNPLDGNVLILLNDNEYTVNLTNGRGNIRISNLIPNDYALRLIYEGDENYSKAFGEKNFTINKTSVNLTIEIENITVGEVGNATISIDSSVLPAEIKLYINNEYKNTITVYNSTTNLILNNFTRGEYLITVEYLGTAYFESANASTTFKVKSLNGSISVSCDNIKIGDNATVIIEADVDDLRGNAILSINGYEYDIYLENKTTNITLVNLTNGTYDLKVFYKGNDKYEPSNASCSFNVTKYSSQLIVDIIPDEIPSNSSDTYTGNIIVKTEPNNCTGYITVFVNIRQYTLNLNNGTCNFSVEFDKGTNYIYVFYEGDYFFKDNSWNTTYGEEDEFTIIASDIVSYEYNDFNYTVLLVEKSGMTMPNRIVNVSFNGENYTIITDNQGKAYFPLNLNIGEYNISASYKNQSVNNKILVKAIDFDLIAYNSTYGENKSIEVIFDYFNSSNKSIGDFGVNGQVNGKIQFKITDLDTGLEIVNEEVIISDNKASYNISQLNASHYSVSARYLNDKFNSTEKNANFSIEKAAAKLNIDCKDINYGETAQIIVNIPNGKGNIQFNVNGTIYNIEIDNSCAILNLSNLNPGTYPVTISFNGDKNYNPCKVNTSFSVRNATSDLKIYVNDTEYGKDLLIIAKLNEDAKGNVTFKINDLIHTCEIKNGTAQWRLNNLETGHYPIEADYSGDNKYIPTGNSTSFEIIKANSFIILYTEDVCLYENIRIYAKLSKNATGTVSFSIENYYSPREKKITNSSANWYISPLDEGTYTVLATYNGDKNYLPSNTSYLLNVSKIKSTLTVEIPDKNVNDNVSINVKLISANNDKINGTVIVTVHSKKYNISVINGAGSLNIGKLALGNYSYTANYEGSQLYSKASAKGEFNVIDNLLTAKLEFKDFNEYYKAGKQLVIKLLDSNKKGISGEVIYLKIKNVTYKLITDSDGNAKININLIPGTYSGIINFNESKTYHKLSDNVKITVMNTVKANNLTKKYNTSGEYVAMFYNPNGKALGNTKVQFTIGKNKYTFTTLANGVLRLNINLGPGRYTIIATNPLSKETARNTIFIFQNIMENRNLVKYYKGSEVYKVRAYENNGKPAISGKTVTFRINGKNHNQKTDKNGYASLKINLNPKTYTITAIYNKFKVSNKIVVKPLLTAKNRIIKKGKNIVFSAKLVNTKGKVLKGKVIRFKLKNRAYSAKTNAKGIAILNRKIALKVGTYKIQTIYGSLKITNTIRIKN